VIAMDRGKVCCDSDPAGFLEWAAANERTLQTPAARLIEETDLQTPPPTGVKQARAALRRFALLPAPAQPDRRPLDPPRSLSARMRRRGGAGSEPATLELKDVWHEVRNGPAVLRGVNLRLQAGETVALMGRNGAGKSTLLRHAAGLLDPTRGSVRSAGRVALLLQNPGDYLLHERVELEAPADALARFDLDRLRERHPRDLSGGERQRLALAVVLGGEERPATLALDEPTRGMDRLAKQELAAHLRALAADGTAVIVATHDAEFAAALALRAVLLADGRPIADGPIEEILAGGWYFATETARILGGAGGALLPEQGAELLRAARREPALLDESRLKAARR
jgi:energy-coupling factor transport system ATP-binding protein